MILSLFVSVSLQPGRTRLLRRPVCSRSRSVTQAWLRQPPAWLRAAPFRLVLQVKQEDSDLLILFMFQKKSEITRQI